MSTTAFRPPRSPSTLLHDAPSSCAPPGLIRGFLSNPEMACSRSSERVRLRAPRSCIAGSCPMELDCQSRRCPHRPTCSRRGVCSVCHVFRPQLSSMRRQTRTCKSLPKSSPALAARDRPVAVSCPASPGRHKPQATSPVRSEAPARVGFQVHPCSASADSIIAITRCLLDPSVWEYVGTCLQHIPVDPSLQPSILFDNPPHPSPACTKCRPFECDLPFNAGLVSTFWWDLASQQAKCQPYPTRSRALAPRRWPSPWLCCRQFSLASGCTPDSPYDQDGLVLRMPSFFLDGSLDWRWRFSSSFVSSAPTQRQLRHVNHSTQLPHTMARTMKRLWLPAGSANYSSSSAPASSSWRACSFIFAS